MSFNHRELRALIAIVDTGSLGRAAADVNMSQPALSRLIHALEARMGVTLFERSYNGMTPTLFGKMLEPHARLLLFEMSQTLAEIDAHRGLRRGTLRIGGVATVARSILPRAIDALLRDAPDLQVELTEAADDRLIAALTGNVLDLVVAGAMPPHDDVVSAGECRFDDIYSAFCSVRHKLAGAKQHRLDDLLAERWVMPAKGATPRSLFEDIVRKHSTLRARVTVETVSPAAIIAFVSQTQLLGWLPQPLFASEQAAGHVVSLNCPELQTPRRFFVYHRRRGLLPPPAVSMIGHLKMV